MRSLVFAALFALAACGQPPTPVTAPSASSAPSAQSERDHEATEEAAEMQTRIAGLPAPYNEASYEAGRRVFAQCRACHTIEAGGGNRVGPNLHAVFGREIGTAPGFAYSQAAQDADFTWDGAHLEQWLANPQTFLAGNRMAFAGIRDETQRRDLIAYLMLESTPGED